MRIHVKIAAFFGFLGVSAGAFGAHALKQILHNRGTTETWQTAVLYTLIHGCSLLIIGLNEGQAPNHWLKRAGTCWILGTLLFSGSLYWLALGGPRFMGPVTPIGGLFLLGGWGCLFLSTSNAKPTDSL
jgi:uncharacterized membrane protein YgdD (TMEM256/DUF423 family)